MLFFLLGPGVVLVSLAEGGLCQSESVREGPSELSPAGTSKPRSGQETLPGLYSATLWGRGLVHDGEGAAKNGRGPAPVRPLGPFLTEAGRGTT